MKIVTWNINGLRSLKKSISTILHELDADVVCFQETKISRSSLPEEMALIEGYSSYFSFSRKQSGYSGVATYCRENFMPDYAEEGLSGVLTSENAADTNLNKNAFLNQFIQSSELCDLDAEGRAVITYHKIRCGTDLKQVAIINIYCPRVDPEKPDRHLYKMKFCHLLEFKAKKLSEENWCVVIVGDFNIAHTIIDHCDPGDEDEFAKSDSRKWLSSFLTPCGNLCSGTEFCDAFRFLHPTEKNAYTCWNVRTGARETNYGTRIDYILINGILLPYLTSCQILSHIQGSDHCPVTASFQINLLASTKLPSICTRFYPEFAGKQQKLQKFFYGQIYTDTFEMEEQKCAASPNLEIVKKQKIEIDSQCNLFKQKSISDFFLKNDKSQNKNVQKSNFGISDFSKSTKKIENIDENLHFDTNKNSVAKISSSVSQTEKWKYLLSGPPKPPLCNGHNKPCVLRTVKKAGLNFGRQFFACPQPDGPSSHPESKCNFFQWVVKCKNT